mmetsp:Transcript_24028/g.21057  ORF Transcript_24028/g.21057 Transcript_24028/m.21057 type:complete len:100 (-) Transcript_24028:235-534(-)|eukprot:CAMPEP_0114588896 /NCGR_PEP_ID=MMETSP0125-20121206/11498_1 /TAXON_ID=485358 ORGANISM="Aristerostoma sp., Strain ATCC 50986" /NCGR_SAMPLE_ID=MMETSP0125 /ASSEMBLY_ACC=CAM_ASM_000245 /LENGTH=99 /DNA_ID=CAMNT_0001785549 /DNA_START=407 /DNA_END=706 /DNA_ORIENTATION=+
MMSYEDISAHDQIHATMKKADEVKDVMGKNVKTMLDNMQSMDKLQEKSSNIADAARTMHTDSRTYARIQYVRKMKLYIIVGCITIALLCYLIIPLVVDD